jgi:hypothetical protein
MLDDGRLVAIISLIPRALNNVGQVIFILHYGQNTTSTNFERNTKIWKRKMH